MHKEAFIGIYKRRDVQKDNFNENTNRREAVMNPSIHDDAASTLPISLQ